MEMKREYTEHNISNMKYPIHGFSKCYILCVIYPNFCGFHIKSPCLNFVEVLRF